MKIYSVLFTPDALSDLENIYDYLCDNGAHPDVAWSFALRIKQKCEKFKTVPVRGRARDDIRKNIRIFAVEKNTVVAFEVDEIREMVIIANIFYGGQDYDAILGDTEDEATKKIGVKHFPFGVGA